MRGREKWVSVHFAGRVKNSEVSVHVNSCVLLLLFENVEFFLIKLKYFFIF